MCCIQLARDAYCVHTNAHAYTLCCIQYRTPITRIQRLIHMLCVAFSSTRHLLCDDPKFVELTADVLEMFLWYARTYTLCCLKYKRPITRVPLRIHLLCVACSSTGHLLNLLGGPCTAFTAGRQSSSVFFSWREHAAHAGEEQARVL